MSLRWIQKRFEKVRDTIQRSIQQGNRGKDSAPAYESNRPATYDLSRTVFLHTLGGIYMIAFCSYYLQFEGLYGTDGIIPVEQQMKVSDGLHWSSFPTLVRWNTVFNTDVYSLCNVLCCSGILLSALAAAGFGCVPVMFGCFVSYLSLVTVGDTFLYFQWDSLLLETGQSPRSSHARCAASGADTACGGARILGCPVRPPMGPTWECLSADPTTRSCPALHVKVRSMSRIVMLCALSPYP
eukprot:3173043-Rhodomonas_salina.1